MKYRLSFVTNSSSSSYICDVCNEVYSERDASLSDADMSECVNGHTICNSHIIENSSDEVNILNEKIKHLINELNDKISDYKRYSIDSSDKSYYEKKIKECKEYITKIESVNTNNSIDSDTETLIGDIKYNYSMEDVILACECPICQREEFKEEDLNNYLLKKLGLTREEIAKECQSNFADYKEFKNYIK